MILYRYTMLLLLPMLVLGAGKWGFTQDDFNSLTSAQKSIIKQSYYIGKPYGLGHTLAAISIVETHAGAYPDKTRNRICGPHQVSAVIAKESMRTRISSSKVCKALQDNPILSAIVSLDILLYWREHSKSFKVMLNRYNRGWTESPHDEEFYRRMRVTLQVLEKNDIE